MLTWLLRNLSKQTAQISLSVFSCSCRLAALVVPCELDFLIFLILSFAIASMASCLNISYRKETMHDQIEIGNI